MWFRLARSVFILAFLCACPREAPLGVSSSRVLLGTTTSAANSGLLDSLLPAFERETGIHVDQLPVGSGVALKYGENGDVDVVLTHDPEAEEAFVRRGFGVSRVPLMYSDFVILGPPTDPASVSGSPTAAEAFNRIAARGMAFVSRGDGSGTHMRERQIWKQAGVAPAGPWYVEAGQGMGTCLMLASEKEAYILSDRGTYVARRDKTSLSILLEGDPILANPYSIIAVSPGRRPGGNHEGALRLIEWLRSPEGQGRIAAFHVGGRPLFFPMETQEDRP